MSHDIQKVEPPALPYPETGYSPSFFQQLNNILRIYFNRLSNAVNQILGTDDGGAFLYFPRGLFFSTVDQTAAATNTGYAVTFNNTYLASSVSVDSNSKITVTQDGVYNFQLTLQLTQTNSSAAELYIWINKNGTDVTYGGKRYTIQGNDYFSVAWNFSIDLEADEYIEMYWATDDTALEIHADAPTSPHPGIPSAVMAVSFVSNY